MERGPILVWILWLGTAMFLVFIVVALVVLGETMSALGWLGFLVGAALAASGAAERSRTLSYLALGSFLVGVLLNGTWFILDTFRNRNRLLLYVEMRPVWVGEIEGVWMSEIFDLEQFSAIPHKTAGSRDYTEYVHNSKLG